MRFVKSRSVTLPHWNVSFVVLLSSTSGFIAAGRVNRVASVPGLPDIRGLGHLQSESRDHGKNLVQILIQSSEIDERVRRLGQQLDRDLPEGPLVVIGVLNGAFMFLADLIRQIQRPQQVVFVEASSYRDQQTSPGKLHLALKELPPLSGRNVLVVDDIFDTGRTLDAILAELDKEQPKSLFSVVLLRKPARRVVDVQPDYFGFDIPDVFAVGYGLDFDGEYRQLPWLAVLDRD